MTNRVPPVRDRSNGPGTVVKIGGHVSGTVVAGGTPSAPAAGSRLGFMVDIIGFGHRATEEKEELRRRLDMLVARVLADLGIAREKTDSDAAGDSAVVFLPAGTASPYVLPRMITAMAERLGRDNQRYRDRMRLRMAVGSGQVASGSPGFTGELIADLRRLVDSVVLRLAIRDHEDTDLALLVSRALHDEVIRTGYLDKADFTEVEITTKDFTTAAWLRCC